MKGFAKTGAVLALALVAAAAVRFGGWAVVSVETMPDYLVVGRPATVTFAVRQHAVDLLTDIQPRVVLAQGGKDVAAKATLTRDRRYSAQITPPATGDWKVTIESGFGRSKGLLLPMRAIAPDAPAPAKPTDAERGRLMFAAKGCVTCHVHGDVALKGELSDFGPDLTDKRFAPTYLAQFLGDPTIKPATNGKTMPKPHLGTEEISLLVAFINSERRAASK